MSDYQTTRAAIAASRAIVRAEALDEMQFCQPFPPAMLAPWCAQGFPPLPADLDAGTLGTLAALDAQARASVRDAR